jgi:hypothetical protein
MLIRTKAEKAAQMMCASGVPEKAALDPLTVAAIVAVIVEVLKVLKGCGLFGDKALRKIHNPGLVHGLVLRRTVRRVARERFGGRPDLREYATAIELNVHSMALTLTAEEIGQMQAEL